VMNFNFTVYFSSNHAAEEYLKRIQKVTPTDELIKETKNILPGIVVDGEIIIEFGKYRYVRNDKAFFPCVRVEDGRFLIRTTMRWSDVEHRLQEIVDLYARQ